MQIPFYMHFEPNHFVSVVYDIHCEFYMGIFNLNFSYTLRCTLTTGFCYPLCWAGLEYSLGLKVNFTGGFSIFGSFFLKSKGMPLCVFSGLLEYGQILIPRFPNAVENILLE